MGLLQNRVAVVTGGGRGIGRAVALLMARHGARVLVNDTGTGLDGDGVDRSPADQVVQEIQAAGGVAAPSYHSVSSVEGGEKIVQDALNHFHTVDILVAAAGILRDRTVFDTTEEDWNALVGVHLKGTFSVVRAAARAMRGKAYGRIVTFTSAAGLYGTFGQAAYGAVKDGVAGFARVVARDLGRFGITVNCVAPRAETRMTASVPDDIMRQRQEVLGVPQPTPTSDGYPPEAVAHLVAFLCTDTAGDINGQLFYVAGGVVSLLSHPAVTRTVRKPSGGRWSVEELAVAFPLTLGVGLANPAPPRESP
ncbi:MAG: SDR family oxidoreductase [Chloroflexi bacterium]|nr:SDR family oxidoreductase [Chloroflexota bacterium]